MTINDPQVGSRWQEITWQYNQPQIWHRICYFLPFEVYFVSNRLLVSQVNYKFYISFSATDPQVTTQFATTEQAVTTPVVITEGVTTPDVTTQDVTTQAVTTPAVTTQAVTTPGVTTQAATTRPESSSGPDTIPPVITSCPEDITAIASAGETSAAVIWDMPTATDDSGATPAVFNSFNPGDVFFRGNTEVLYIFVDGAFNQAICRFIITVTTGKT